MFNLFKKKANEIACPMDGEVMAITEVNDPVFASKAMGDGFAVEPSNGKVFSPIVGKVTSVFPTKHAIGLLSDSGAEILVHIGINTVDLAGAGFEILVTEGDTVDLTTPLAVVDLEYLKEQEKPVTTMVIWTNSEGKEINVQLGKTNAKTVIGKLK